MHYFLFLKEDKELRPSTLRRLAVTVRQESSNKDSEECFFLDNGEPFLRMRSSAIQLEDMTKYFILSIQFEYHEGMYF